MRKIFSQIALMSALLLTVGLIQANSELKFDLTAGSTADLVWVSTTANPEAPPTGTPPLYGALPERVDALSSVSALLTGQFGTHIFELTSILYNLVEGQNQVAALSIFMSNATCRVNGVEANSPSLPLWFPSTEGVYKVNLTKVNYGYTVNCHLTVTPDTSAPQTINVKISNMSGAEGGTLASGLVSLNYNTTCTANDTSGDCKKAASIPILPSYVSPLFTFKADPTERELAGSLFYPIWDDNGLPGVHYVAVYLQNGENVTDRCKTEITPPTTGPVHYQAQAYQVGTDEENTCVVNVTRYVN